MTIEVAKKLMQEQLVTGLFCGFMLGSLFSMLLGSIIAFSRKK